MIPASHDHGSCQAQSSPTMIAKDDAGDEGEPRAFPSKTQRDILFAFVAEGREPSLLDAMFLPSVPFPTALLLFPSTTFHLLRNGHAGSVVVALWLRLQRRDSYPSGIPPGIFLADFFICSNYTHHEPCLPRKKSTTEGTTAHTHTPTG